MRTVSIAFVDDHPALLEGICAIFGRKPRYKIVATGVSCAEALEIAIKSRPEILVMDLNMPGSAFDCIKQIRIFARETKIVVLTASSGICHAVDALKAGASGYVLKGSPLESLREAIDCVMEGETYISKGFSAKVFAALTSPLESRMKLSVREEQIVALLLESRTNREMARAMKLSEKTIKNYMSLLMQKLKVRNRVGLVLAARSLPISGGGPNDLDRIGLLN